MMRCKIFWTPRVFTRSPSKQACRPPERPWPLSAFPYASFSGSTLPRTFFHETHPDFSTLVGTLLIGGLAPPALAFQERGHRSAGKAVPVSRVEALAQQVNPVAVTPERGAELVKR